nr:hypothetical protein [Tanacetum cinerariifolium]
MHSVLLLRCLYDLMHLYRFVLRRCALLSVFDLRLRRVLLLLLLGPLGYRADYGFIGTLDAELRRDQVREIGYKITNVWEDPTEATKEVPPTTMAELSQRVMDLLITVKKDTDEIYVKFEDVQYNNP